MAKYTNMRMHFAWPTCLSQCSTPWLGIQRTATIITIHHHHHHNHHPYRRVHPSHGRSTQFFQFYLCCSPRHSSTFQSRPVVCSSHPFSRNSYNLYLFKKHIYSCGLHLDSSVCCSPAFSVVPLFEKHENQSLTLWKNKKLPIPLCTCIWLGHLVEFSHGPLRIYFFILKLYVIKTNSCIHSGGKHRFNMHLVGGCKCLLEAYLFMELDCWKSILDDFMNVFTIFIHCSICPHCFPECLILTHCDEAEQQQKLARRMTNIRFCTHTKAILLL